MDVSGSSDPEAIGNATGNSSPEGGGACELRVGGFAGPLDLLLHLVRINELDILDIPIVEITEQYSQHLELMRQLNLEVAGEYLVMAATLMHIKSRMLLPPDPDAVDEEGEDPRSDLARELLEYQRFKQAAETLEAIDTRRSLVWTRDRIPQDFQGEELLAVDLFDLLKAFRGLLSRLGEEARIELRRDNVSVAEKITWISGILERRRSVELLELLRDLATRLDRIAAFLAVLEMLRLHMIVAFQRKALGEIRIALIEGDADAESSVAEGSGSTGAPTDGVPA